MARENPWQVRGVRYTPLHRKKTDRNIEISSLLIPEKAELNSHRQ
jgi:hypothetical protein